MSGATTGTATQGVLTSLVVNGVEVSTSNPLPVTGGGGGGGGSGGTVTQGPANTTANAWPAYLAQGATPVAVGASNGLYVQPGAGVTFSVSLPGPQAVTLASVPQATAAGTVTALASTAVSGSSSTTIVPAASGVRYRATIYNTSSTTMWMRSDGGTAAVGTGIPIAAGGGYEWVYPLTGAAPAPPITAIMATATAGTVSGEYVQ